VASALAQCQDLLAVRERTPGPEPPDTLAAQLDLAHGTAMAGDTLSACEQYAALVPVADRVLGAYQPATVAIRRLYRFKTITRRLSWGFIRLATLPGSTR
jgi:hypothetical protein